MTSKKTKPSSIFKSAEPWANNDNPIWLASTLKLTRNIEKFNFPGKISSDRRKQLVSLVGNALTDSKLLDKPSLILAEDLSALQKEFLYEHFLTLQSLHQAHLGEAFVVDKTARFLGILNIRDHIQLLSVDCSGELENTCSRLVDIEVDLGGTIDYAFNKKFGFLTASPNHCGTGLAVHVYLQLPALIHSDKLHTLLNRHCQDGVTVTGLHGDPDELIGDVVTLSNCYSLGTSDENIVSALRNSLTKLIVDEKSMRAQIRDNKDGHIMDQISRAFGLLRHSYQLEAVEAMGALSLMKLGIDLGWVEGVNVKQLNALFFGCRRGHLLGATDEELDTDAITHQRSDYLHKTLKKAKLKV